MATNPVVSMPEADIVKAALSACPFVVVSDVLEHTDTADCAHVKLPAYGWAEKDGLVTNSERRISRQRALVPAEGHARPDWWIICEVAKRMGWAEAFDFANPVAIIREFAASSNFEPKTRRDFDISALAEISDQDFDDLEPFQWPWRAGGTPSETRFFADGGFYHPDQRARLIPVKLEEPTEIPNHPFVLNTGRIRDQWHTMTRTARAARLNQHLSEPFVEIHPEDARANDIMDADLVMLHNERGTAVVRALLTDAATRETLFAPMHWTAQVSSSGRINTLVEAKTDPFSAQPAFKNVPTQIARAPFEAYGFLISRHEPITDKLSYWAKSKTEAGWRCELAGSREAVLSSANLDPKSARTFQDRSGRAAYAWFDGDQLSAALFLDVIPVEVSRSWACDLLERPFETDLKKLAVLAGRPGADQPDPGAIVCACNSVGINQICTALADLESPTVEALAQASNAGTGCGTCRSILKSLIETQEQEKAFLHAAA